MRTKVVSFFIFFQELSSKKIKALRPKMTKIGSRGRGGGGGPVLRLEYEERIVNVHRGSFCPLVFSASGAVGPLCDRFLKRLAGKISNLDQANYCGCHLSDLAMRSWPSAS